MIKKSETQLFEDRVITDRRKNIDDLDILLRDHGDVFPDDWDPDDIMNFCCRYVISNISDIEELFHDDGS